MCVSVQTCASNYSHSLPALLTSCEIRDNRTWVPQSLITFLIIHLTQHLAAADLTTPSRSPYYHLYKNHGFPNSLAALDLIKFHYFEKVKWFLAHEPAFLRSNSILLTN